MVRVIANGLGDQRLIPDRVLPKTQKKRYLMPSCKTLSIIRYGSLEISSASPDTLVQ